jgi:hypothetical protein
MVPAFVCVLRGCRIRRRELVNCQEEPVGLPLRERLGRLVQQTVDAQPSLLETGRGVGASAARIEALARPALPVPAEGALRRGVSWRAWALSAALAAAATALLLWAGSQDWRERAQLGHALQSAWPALDAATRMKLSERMGRPS